MAELPIAVAQIQCDGAACPCRCAADFRNFELDAIRHVDPDPMFVTGRWADDRASARLQHSRDRDMRTASLHVHPKLDWPEDRWMDGRRHRTVDPPMGL